jgi:hypothetical protein
MGLGSSVKALATIAHEDGSYELLAEVVLISYAKRTRELRTP